MLRVALGLLGLTVALALAGCSHLAATDAAGDGAGLSRQILVTARQPSGAAFALAGDPTTAYARRRGYGPAPETDRLLDSIASDYGLRRVDGWMIGSLGVYCEVFELAPGQDATELVARVAADTRIDSVQAMNVFETEGMIYNDPYAGLQPALSELAIDAAHERATGKGVRVAVIDSLVDDRHPDIRGRVAVRRDLAAGHRPVGRAEVHGTATAGIIASAANNAEGIVGVAPEAEILALRACWTVDEVTGRARCSSFSLARALGAALELGVDVINLSLSGPRDPLLERLVDAALAEGAIVVAAWPDDAASEGDFPASHPGVIAVGASGPAMFGPPGLLRAPGREVLSTVPDADYAFFSGNSMSAAFVAGVAALLVEQRPGIDTAAVSARLRSSGTADTINVCRAVAGDECLVLSAATAPLAQAQTSR
jgi:subtilisin family serine protease